MKKSRKTTTASAALSPSFQYSKLNRYAKIEMDSVETPGPPFVRM